MTKRLESFLLEFLRTLRFPLEKTRYSGLRNPYHAKKNVNDPVNQRVPWQIDPRRAKEKPLSDRAMRRPSTLAGLPGDPTGINGQGIFVFLCLSQREHPKWGSVQSRTTKVVPGPPASKDSKEQLIQEGRSTG